MFMRGVCDCFDIKQLCLRSDRFAEVFRVVGIHEGRLDPQSPQGHVELCIGPTIQCRRRNQFVPTLAKAADREELSGLPAARGEASDASFE